MDTQQATQAWPSLSTLVLGLMAGTITLGTAARLDLPVVSSERTAALALAGLGFLMCTVGGIGQIAPTYGWTHPVTLAGSALGLLALGLTASLVFGVRLPLVTDERAAFFALAGVIALKVGIHVFVRLRA